jgi:hypothetical protein
VVADSQRSGKILEFNTIIRVENNNLIEERSFRIKVENKQSEWMSDIRIPYGKSSRLEILDAYVQNSNGETVRKLLKKEISDLSDISENAFYEDDMAKGFSLRSNEYPYFVFYSYRKTTSKFFYLALWSPLYWAEVESDKSTLKVEIPRGYKIRISDTGNYQFKKDSTEDKFIYYWEATHVLPVKREIMAPPDRELFPLVYIVPENFTYGVPGKLVSWKSLGTWQDEINSNMDLLTLSEQIKVTSILKGVTDRGEKTRTLYHYMQDNTHYINVSIDIGGMQPYPASYVCNNKYGDCKALTMYMKALLKFAGIESYYTPVYAGTNPVRVNKDFPAFQFNHVILCVPNRNDTLWLENTSQTAPFGYLGSFTQNRYALVANGPQSRLVRTPAMGTEEFLEESFYRIGVEFSGESSVHMEKILRGNAFMRWLEIAAGSSEEETKEAFSAELPIKNNLLKYEIMHPDRDQKFLKLVADMNIDRTLREIGNSHVIIPFPIIALPFEKPSERKYPVRINNPVNKSDSVVYEIPFMDQYNVEVPSDIRIETKFGIYRARFIKGEKKVTLVRSFFMPVNDYPREEYDEMYAFIESINRSMKNSVIILNKKS